tara:strand:+ start:3676 stop:4791 length:1116 start_codon:yes stop_codon:yes gene_type:complete
MNESINQNTNCGLDSLSNIVSLKGVSMRTLIYAAEDNGVKLFPYKVSKEEFKNIPYPAIIHSENHFEYAESFEDVNVLEATGNILLNEKSSSLNPVTLTAAVFGETWVTIGVTAVGIGYSMYESDKAGKEKDKAKRAMDAQNKPNYIIPSELYKNLSEEEKRLVEGLPAQQKAEYVKSIERGRVSALRGAKDRKTGLQGLQASTSGANDAYSNLVSMDAQAKMKNKDQQRENIAAYRKDIAIAKNMQYGDQMRSYSAELKSNQADYQAAAQTQNAANQSAISMGIGAAGALAGSGNRTTDKDKGTGAPVLDTSESFRAAQLKQNDGFSSPESMNDFKFSFDQNRNISGTQTDPFGQRKNTGMSSLSDWGLG